MARGLGRWYCSNATTVARWLDALTLSQYSSAFIEASVDGPFLLEVRNMIENASLYPTYYDVCTS